MHIKTERRLKQLLAAEQVAAAGEFQLRQQRNVDRAAAAFPSRFGACDDAACQIGEIAATPSEREKSFAQ